MKNVFYSKPLAIAFLIMTLKFCVFSNEFDTILVKIKWINHQMPLRSTILTISWPLFSSDNEISASQNKDRALTSLISSEVGVQVGAKWPLTFPQITPTKNATIYSNIHYYDMLHSELQHVSFHWGTIFRNQITQGLNHLESSAIH